MRKTFGVLAPALPAWVLPAVTLELRGSVSSAMPSSIDPRLGRNRFHVVAQRLHMHRPVAKAWIAVLAQPGNGVLQPVRIVALGEILARMGAAAFGPVGR